MRLAQSTHINYYIAKTINKIQNHYLPKSEVSKHNLLLNYVT